MSVKITKQKATRSRAGCLNCKKRKKKCDEVKPICTGCFKRNIKCEYKSLQKFVIENDNSQLMDVINCDKETLGEVVMEIIMSKNDLPIINNDFFDFIGGDSNLLALDDDFINNLLFPIPNSNLQIKLPISLNSKELKYFEFYCKEILPNLSLLPQEFNHYSKIYFPIAFKSKFVLYCLILWGCKYLNGSNNLQYHIENEEIQSYTNKILMEIDKNAEQDYLSKDDFISSFVSCMLLVVMEASFGDTINWSGYFLQSFHLLNKMPGNFKYLLNECGSLEGSVLAQSFAYFDVLASQSNEYGTYYDIEDYSQVFQLNSNKTILDPLQGCIRPLILNIGKIINLLVDFDTYNSNKLLNKMDKFNSLKKVLKDCESLESEIKQAKPDLTCLDSKNTTDLEFHLTLFELFQISSRLYLKMSIKKLPSNVPEIQILYFTLKQDLIIMIENPLFRKSLAFPMLFLGLCSIDDRSEVKLLFEKLIQNCGYLCSYYKIWVVVQKVWEINQSGSIYVDWYKITKKLGWKISLGR